MGLNRLEMPSSITHLKEYIDFPITRYKLSLGSSVLLTCAILVTVEAASLTNDVKPDIAVRSNPGIKEPPVVASGPNLCGYSNLGDLDSIRDRVQEKEHADFLEYPWMIALLRRSLNSSAWSHAGYLGGGTLIHPRVVLTAAHKVHGLKAEDMKCRAGEWDTLNTDEIYGHQEQNVAKIVRHPDFYYDSILNSVALLFLAAPFRQAPNVGLACLGPQLPPAGTVCYSSGWGKQKLGAKDSEIGGMLKKVELPLLSRSECQARLRKTRLSNYFTLHESLMCAGGEEGKDTCAGDGGSPLVCHIGDPSHQRFALYGMVAYGIGCGEDGVPGVYVDAPHFHSWVMEKMREEGLGTESFMFIE